MQYLKNHRASLFLLACLFTLAAPLSVRAASKTHRTGVIHETDSSIIGLNTGERRAFEPARPLGAIDNVKDHESVSLGTVDPAGGNGLVLLTREPSYRPMDQSRRIDGQPISTGGDGRTAPGVSLTTRRIPVRIGATQVVIVVHQSDSPGPTYLNLHDDENTSVKSALDRLRRCGGRVIELQHGGTRYITFTLNGTDYTFDPNRIFTDRGAIVSLKEQGPYSDQALAATRAFAEKILDVLNPATLERIVTIHNNTEHHYSAASYFPGAKYGDDAAAVYISDGADPDDFFFVTRRSLYDKLKSGERFAVVLQNNAGVTDDGSLSVYAAQHGLAYVNVEAQGGHRDAQAAMYRYLSRQIGSKGACAAPSGGNGNEF